MYVPVFRKPTRSFSVGGGCGGGGIAFSSQVTPRNPSGLCQQEVLHLATHYLFRYFLFLMTL